jgi:hypothetical protein
MIIALIQNPIEFVWPSNSDFNKYIVDRGVEKPRGINIP